MLKDTLKVFIYFEKGKCQLMPSAGHVEGLKISLFNFPEAE